MKFNKRAVAMKIEPVYGTDSVPTAAANALLLSNVNITPMPGDSIERNLVGRSIGQQAQILVGTHVVLEGSIELAGSGAAGTAPAWGPALRACGFSETVTVATDTVYAPVSDNEESVSIYFNIDGQRHVMLGCRGSLSLQIPGRGIPTIRCRFTGLFQVPTAVAYPTSDFTAFRKPLAITNANTPTFTLHGHAGVLHNLAIDQSNTVVHRDFVNEESVIITDRGMNGTVTIDDPRVDVKDFYTAAKDETLGVMQLVHGTVAGNVIQIDAPQVQVGRPTVGDADRQATMTLPLGLVPTAGDDELTITVR